MASIYEYLMWQDFNNNVNVHDHSSSDPSIPNHEKLFDIHLLFLHVLELSYPSDHRFTFNATRKSYSFPLNAVSSSSESRVAIFDPVLSSTGAARELVECVLPDTSEFAFNMVNHPCNANAHIITMVVNIFVLSPYDDRDLIDRALGDVMQENLSFKAASKSCVEGLTRIRVKEGDDEENCGVCLEKQLVGEEVIWLPCGHVFHGDCIVKWLETSHLCPLCRFSMDD